MNIEFADQLSEEGIRVVGSVGDVGGKAKVVGTTGQDATAAILPNQQELHDDLLAGMIRWEATPKGETANIEQFLTVEQHVSPSHPSDLVTHHVSVRCQTLLQVEGIGGVIHHVAFPGQRIGSKRLGTNRSMPELDVLLMWPNIVQILQAGSGTSHEPASLGSEHCDHALDYRGIEQHIIVDEVRVRGHALLQQKLTLLRHASATPSRVHRYPVPVPLEGSNHRPKFDSLKRRLTRSLVRDDDIEVGKCLTQ